MKRDKSIDEIRTVRHEISKAFGHDTRALLDHYKELEKHYQDRLIGRRSVVTTDKKKKRSV